MKEIDVKEGALLYKNGKKKKKKKKHTHTQKQKNMDIYLYTFKVGSWSRNRINLTIIFF